MTSGGHANFVLKNDCRFFALSIYVTKGEFMISTIKSKVLRTVNANKHIVRKFARTIADSGVPLEIMDVDGTVYSPGIGARYRLTIRDQRFFRALLSPDAFALGDAYVNGYFDLSGDIQELYEHLCDKVLVTDRRIPLVRRLTDFLTGSREKEARNIDYHYNVPSGFYELFLGQSMGYTCGYYADAAMSMDQAQYEKMDIICRKLRLKPGDRLLDIGCGWGSFLIYAARNYGVLATGITLSREQADYARSWIEREGLTDRCSVRLINYRDIGGETYDKISCVGMSEHVGYKNMKTFFNIVFNALKEHGLFLQHTITTNTARRKGTENTFLEKYMFPGGELLLQHSLLEKALASRFELISAENFRVHYIKTLRDWISRMELNKQKILRIVPETVYRIYYIFFVGSLVYFKNQEISLVQNLFYKKSGRGNVFDYFVTPFSRNENRII